MKELLIKVRNKSVLMKLKELGTIEPVSSIMNIFSITVKESDIGKLLQFDGIETIEENDFFEVQR